MDQGVQNPQTPWYRTGAGKTFVVILSTLLAASLLFFLFVGYYVRQIQKGDFSDLLKQFESDFTADPSLSNKNQSAQFETDVEKYIRATNPVLGEDGAPVTIVMFIDFECPFCQKAYLITKQMIETYSPAIKVVFKQFPIESIHPRALSAAHATQCAKEQGKFWEYHDLVFQKRLLDDKTLSTHAQTLGMDTQKFDLCTKEKKYKKQIDQDLLDGLALSVQGTPTYFINNKKVEGIISPERWDTLILNEIQK